MSQFLVWVEPLMPNSLVPQLFDFLDRPNSSASAGSCAIQSRSGAAKFKYFWKCVAAQQGIGEAGVEDVTRSGCVDRVHPESGGVVELCPIPCENAVASQGRSGHAATETARDLRQRLQQVRNAEQAFGELAGADHE